MAFAGCKRHPLDFDVRFWPARTAGRRRPHYWTSRTTAWLACEASDKAVVESCCRVCNARRLAPSSLGSASVRLSAPVVSVLTIALVKSWRICTVDRFEPKAWDCERSVVSALVRSAEAAWISTVAPQLL